MTIDEAVEALTEYQHAHHSFTADRFGKAMLLGIQALKRVKKDRTLPYPLKSDRLPGETEE